MKPLAKPHAVSRCALGAALFLHLAGHACGQAELTWRLKEGERLYVEEKSDRKQTVTFAGQKTEQQTVSRSVAEFTVKSRSQGGVNVEQRSVHWHSTQSEYC